MVGVLVGERGAHVAPVIPERRRDLLLGGDDELSAHLPNACADQVEQRAEALDGQQLGDVRAPFGGLAIGRAEGAGGRRDLGELAVLRRQLGSRGDLDLLHVPQRALRERREPAQRFDLDVEHVHPNRVLLGGGEHVEQPAAQGELSALLHLVDALVAGAHQLARALVEVEQLADAQCERAGSQLGVGDLLGERDSRDDDDRGVCFAHGREQRVECRDAQPHKMRWRGQV